VRMARIGVGGVLMRGDRLLLGRRTADRVLYPSIWDMPGGHWVEGETYEQTLRRELGEELGIVPLEYRLLGVLSDPKPDRHGEGHYYVYLVTRWTGDPHNLRPDEHVELVWVKFSEVEKLDPISPDFVDLLRSACEGGPSEVR
jgi:8-oxo-dGTP diphosphatase